MAGGIAMMQVVTSALAAYAFARLRFRGRDVLFYIYLGTLIIPPQVTVIPQFLIVRELGWVDSYAGLIIPQAFTAFGVFLLRQFFMGIPFELEDAARIDGANRFRQLQAHHPAAVRPGAGDAWRSSPSCSTGTTCCGR